MKKYTFIFAMLVVLSSCKKSFLEKLPQDTLPPETFYQNGDNLKIALTGIYDGLQDQNNFGKLPDIDGITDNGIHFRYESELISFAQGIANANSTEKFAQYYQAGYLLIQRANLLLDHINAPGTTVSPQDRKLIAAEARALRALAYMRLVYLYGDLPFFTNFIDLATSKTLSRTPRAQIIAFIQSEFRAAATDLSTLPANNEKGRFTRQAALSFLAKTSLFESRMGNKPWSETLTEITTAVQVAEQGGAGLYTSATPLDGKANFEGLFALANRDNKEYIFVVKNNDVDRTASLYGFFGAGGGNLSMSVHTNLVNDYYCTDGKPITTSPLYDARFPYRNRDPRLMSTVTVPGDTYSTGTQNRAFNGKTTIGVLQTDFAIKKMTTTNGLAQNQGMLDIPVLRFADLLLMLAEADNEVNGPSSVGYGAINRVRQRAGMPQVAAGLTKESFRDEVIHERRTELAFEGHRWFDLITLKIAAQKINAINELDRKFVSDKQELFPIPQSERSLNPNLTQNKGY